MGFWKYFFGSEPAVTEPDEWTEVRPRPTEAIAVPVDSPFDLAAFHAAAHAAYQKESTGRMAVAAAKVAELIAEHFETREVRCMVPAEKIDESALDGSLPVHFLFSRDGEPKVAVVIVTKHGRYTPNVLATEDLCRGRGITYLWVYADGPNADWIYERVSPDLIERCNKRLIDNIRQGLE